MTAFAVFAWGWGVVALVMLALWAVQYRSHNAGIVDVAWAFGTALLGVWVALATQDGDPGRKLLVAGMAAVWGVRLGTHLAARVFSETEDGRYRYLRGHLGSRVQPFMFAFFQVQALWAVLFALPMWAAAVAPTVGLGWPDLAALVVFATSIGGEAIADAQLARFRRDPDNRGKVCRAGLWRYSRHPHNFCEWLHWFAYVILAAGSSLWWLPVAGVVMVYLFLTRITGIPFTEQQALRSRGEAYRRYQRTTSPFFPWPPQDNREIRT